MILRRRRHIRFPLSKRKAYFWAILIFLFINFQLLLFVEKKLEPTMIIIAKQKAEQLAKEAMADAVTKKITQSDVNFNDIVRIEKDNDGKIRNVNLEFKEYSRFISETNERIKNNLREIEQDKIENSIPLGMATGSPLLADLGPMIPIKFSPIGSVKTRMETSLTDAGINMVMVTVYITVDVDLSIAIPFAIDKTTVSNKIPVTNSLVIGDVPTYWYNNPDGKPDVPRTP